MLTIFFFLFTSSLLALQNIQLIDLTPKWSAPRRACEPEPACPQICSYPSSTSSTSSCSSSSSSSCSSSSLEHKQEFIYEFLTPKGNRDLIIKAYGHVDGELEIWDIDREVRIYNSLHPCSHKVHLKLGQNNLRFVYTSCKQATPILNMVDPGCTCDSLRSRLTLGRFVVYWCSEKSPFFDTKMMPVGEDTTENE